MEFNTEIFSQYDKKWALLTAGKEADFNTMTISWGGLGTIWGKPVATVYVCTSRYTHDSSCTVGIYSDNEIGCFDTKIQQILRKNKSNAFVEIYT